MNNKKADDYLSSFALQLKEMTLKSKSNDFIYEKLEVLESFVYKTPEQVINIFKYILKTNYPAKKSRSKFGIIEGKTRMDVILKGLDLLSEIRYILPNAVLPLLEKAIINEENPAREKALEILKKLSEYNLNVLKSKIGYGAQRTALDYILKWSSKKQLAHIDFVLTVVKEVLNSSVEGSSWTDEKTLTMSFSHVDPTDFLKKMRRETMDFIYNIYTEASDAKIRLQLAFALEKVMYGPSNGAYSDALKEMIEDDTKYLASIYQKIIFDESGNLIRENIAVAKEIEERLHYFARPEKKFRPELTKLHDDILNDPFYEKVYPLIGGGRSVYKNEEGYENSMALRATGMQKLIANISDESLNEWRESLEILASQRTVNDEWKLADFKRFLELFSSEKPELGDKILEGAFKTKSALLNFSESFLIGFQDSQKFDLWDKYSELIAKKQDARLIGGICNSLIAKKSDQAPRKLRSNELAILEEIVFKKKRFNFLQLKKKDESVWYLHDRLFNALSFNFKPQQQKMEQLIKEEMESGSEYKNIHYNVLHFATTAHRWIDLSLTSKPFKRYLLRRVVEVPELNWELQEFLIELCEKNTTCIMSVFEKRIARSIRLEKDDKTRGQKRWMKPKEFEAIPYHFNPDLQKLLTESKDFSTLIRAWVGKMDLDWSSYNWEVSQFLEGVGVDRRQVLFDIVEQGNDDDLLRVSYAIEGIDTADFELCVHIIGRTDNKKVHDKIESVMYATGVVSGEYGIAEAYEKKSEMLKKYLDNGNDRVKKFSQEMIEGLKQRAEEERKRVAEEIQLRKINFEG